MTKKNKKAKTIKYNGYTCKLVEKWIAPESAGVPLLTMPNIPHPLHNQNPRNIFGPSTWDHMRNKCYYDADYTCEICGEKVATEYNENGTIKHKYHDDGTLAKRNLHAHEIYDIDYNKGTARFIRAVSVCKNCHVNFIHSGRMFTMYKKGDPLTTKEVVLKGLERGFKQIKQWNDTHYGEEKLRVYFTVLEYVDDPEIGEEIKELIDKYEIEFYIPNGEMMPRGVPVWGDWKLIIGTKEYKTPFHSQKEWEEAMDKNNKEQFKSRSNWINRFKKYEGLESVQTTDEDMKKVDEAEVPPDF